MHTPVIGASARHSSTKSCQLPSGIAVEGGGDGDGGGDGGDGGDGGGSGGSGGGEGGWSGS